MSAQPREKVTRQLFCLFAGNEHTFPQLFVRIKTDVQLVFLLLHTMAEIFGAVASGAGLVTLAIQLLESSQRLQGFYDVSKGALQAIADLSFGLRTMSLSLQQLESYRRSEVLSYVLSDELLEQCDTTWKRMIGKIESAVNKMKRQIQRSRNVGRINAAFREPETRRLLEEMEQAKSSMLFTHMSYCQYVLWFVTILLPVANSWKMLQHPRDIRQSRNGKCAECSTSSA